MKAIIFIVAMMILTLGAYFICLKICGKLYRVVNPVKCCYTMFVINVGEM